MPDVSIITAVGPYHLPLIERVKASVAAQTIPCHHLLVVDRQGKGAGWARNRGLERVQTPFVIFLDADDEIAPTFVERCLSAFDGSRYIYTDWLDSGTVKHAPECAWFNRSWHVITTLLPTDWVREVGGFDETLPGGEDTKLYLDLTTRGHCGRRLGEPLFIYGKEGQRAHAFVHSAAYEPTLQRFTEEYGGKQMQCCGGGNTDDGPIGEKQAGDVLAQSLWGGNRVERGRATGRMYPRSGNGKQMWVDPRDVAASPHLWREVVTLRQFVPDLYASEQTTVEYVDLGPPRQAESLDEIGAFLFGHVAPAPALPVPVAPVQAKPNVRKVSQLARGRTA